MARFKPQATGYKDDKGYDVVIIPAFAEDTYPKLMKKVREYAKEGKCDLFSINKSKRGEWGEWFEHWRKTIKPNGTYSIRKFKEGWM